MWLLLACHDPDEPAPATTTMLVVSDSGHGRLLYTDGSRSERAGEMCLRELIPDDCPESTTSAGDTDAADFARCLTFGVRHELVDGHDELELAYARYLEGQDNLPGALVRFAPLHPPNVLFTFDDLLFSEEPLATTCATPGTGLDECGLRMPHAFVRSGDERIIADTLNNRVLWVDPPLDGSSRGAVRHVLDESNLDWDVARYPNNLEIYERAGSTLLLVSYKGSNGQITGNEEFGRIKLWDITDPEQIHLRWSYPAEGYLAAVHGAVVRTIQNQEVLLYAHAFGASDDIDAPGDGSVGIAVMAWEEPPSYLGDLRMEPSDEPYGFIRAVEVLDEGADGGAATLLVTDSGCENQEVECTRPVGVLETALDQLPPASGLTGAYSNDHANQTFVEVMDAADPYRDTFKFPFMALPLRSDAIGPELAQPLGSCP